MLTGDEIRKAQSLLTAKGYRVDVDGIFGPGTHGAVVQFQMAEGLSADGIVGPDTWARLEANTAEESRELTKSLRDDQTAIMLKIRERCMDRQRLAVCDYAIGCLNTAEEPNGSNGGPVLDVLLEPFGKTYYPRSDPKPPWCAVWVSACILKGLGLHTWAGTPMKAWYGAASQFGQWGKEKGVYVQGHEMALAGDILVMQRDSSGSDVGQGTSAGHVGIVLWIDGDEVVSIDGNVSNRIMVKRRKRSAVDYVSWRHTLD